MDHYTEFNHPSAQANPPPAALAQGQPVTHSYSLKDKHGHAWATLNFTCLERPELGTKHLPYILEGETVTGSVDLDLPEEKTIKSVKISLVGEQPTNLDLEAAEFVKVTQVLWPADGSDASSSHSSLIGGGHKLKGQYHWPFELALPATAEYVGEDGRRATRTLPSSSHAADNKVHVEYRVKVTIHYGTLLHFSDDSIDTDIIYFAGTPREEGSQR